MPISFVDERTLEMTSFVSLMLLSKPVAPVDVPYTFMSYLALTRSSMMMFYFLASSENMIMYLASMWVYFLSELHGLYIFDGFTPENIVSTGLQTVFTLIISFTLKCLMI